MLFTVEEIKCFLEQQNSLKDAIENLSVESITESVPPFLISDGSVLFEKNDENLIKYEDHIGMTKLKDEQQILYNTSKGKRGREWMALSPRWSNFDNTKYKISYWANYGDGNTYGHFTVEQILEWFNNPNIQLHELGGTKES